MLFSAASNSARLICWASFVERNQHASSVTDPLISSETPVFKELASIQTSITRAYMYQVHCTVSLSRILIMVSYSMVLTSYVIPSWHNRIRSTFNKRCNNAKPTTSNSGPNDLIGCTDSTAIVWAFSDRPYSPTQSVSCQMMLHITPKACNFPMRFSVRYDSPFLYADCAAATADSSAEVSSFMNALAGASIWTRVSVYIWDARICCLSWVDNPATNAHDQECRLITAIGGTTLPDTCFPFAQASHIKPFMDYKGVRCKRLNEGTLYLLYICPRLGC